MPRGWVLLLAQCQEQELEAIPGERCKEQMGLASHLGPSAPSPQHYPRAAECFVPTSCAICSGYPHLALPCCLPGGFGHRGSLSWGSRHCGGALPGSHGSPPELMCRAVTSAGADGAARSKNILFPCKCHQ